MTDSQAALSGTQKRAGRVFRDGAQAALGERNRLDPPGAWALPYWAVVRHDCTALNGASTGIVLRGRTWLSPEYWACYCGEVAPLAPESFPHRGCDGGRVIAAGGLFAYLFKEGKCSGCGLVVRSRAGRLLLGADLTGRGIRARTEQPRDAGHQ